MKKIGLIAIIITILVNCRTREEIKSESSIVDLEKNISNFMQIHLSDIAKEISYIPLETNNYSIISFIENVDINQESILLSTGEKCLLFDLSGRFISQIGHKGKGPQEYLYPGAVYIGKSFLFVPTNKTLLVFNKSGELVKGIKNPSMFESIPNNNSWLPLSDSLFICHIRNTTGDEENKAVIFDWNSDTIQLIPNYIKFNREKFSSRSDDGKAVFYSFDNEVYFKEYMNDTLFRIKENFNIEPSFVFHLGKYKFPHQLRSLPILEYSKLISKYIWITNFFETNKYFFFECHFGNYYPFKKKEYTINDKTFMGIAPVIGMYEKETGKTFFVKPELDDNLNPNGIKNDLDGGLNFFPQARVNDSTLLMSFTPYDLLEYTSSDLFKTSTPKSTEKKKELQELASRLDRNDNPVLMLVKLKE